MLSGLKTKSMVFNEACHEKVCSLFEVEVQRMQETVYRNISSSRGFIQWVYLNLYLGKLIYVPNHEIKGANKIPSPRKAPRKYDTGKNRQRAQILGLYLYDQAPSPITA